MRKILNRLGWLCWNLSVVGIAIYGIYGHHWALILYGSLIAILSILAGLVVTAKVFNISSYEPIHRRTVPEWADISADMFATMYLGMTGHIGLAILTLIHIVLYTILLVGVPVT